MAPISIERSIWIDGPRERVWRAVTTPEQLNQWYAALYRWEIPALEIGAEVTFYNKDNRADAQRATIVTLDPPREFTLRWTPTPDYPQVTLVTSFLLSEEGGGTRATIHETGYDQVPAEERQQWLDATGSGYAVSVENLRALVEARG